MKQLDLILYPELRSVTRQDRDRLLRSAREEPFDLLELLGMAAAVVLVTSLTRYGLRADALEQFAMGVASFVVAIPLLAATAGPFLYRRTRRGLRRELHRRLGAGSAG
jgi:hypothetical protein